MRVRPTILCDVCGKPVSVLEGGCVLWDLDQDSVEMMVAHHSCDDGDRFVVVDLMYFIKTNGMQEYWNRRVLEALQRSLVREVVRAPGLVTLCDEPRVLREARALAQVEQVKEDVVAGLRRVFEDVDRQTFFWPVVNNGAEGELDT